MMKRKRLLIPIVLSVLVMVLMLSGCVMPTWVRTTGWTHTGLDDGTSVELRGSLFTKQVSDWNLFIVWDDQSHSDWEDYEYMLEPDGYTVRAKSFAQYYIELDGLVRTKTYYYRAVGEFLLRTRSEWYQGLEIAFTPGLPLVKTIGAINIMDDSAEISGYLERKSGAATCTVWFEYDEEDPDGSSPTVFRNETTHNEMTVIGAFSTTIENLNSNTTYYYRAVASNDVGEYYGILREFTTAKE